MKRPFHKPALTLVKQVRLLRRRGMVIDDRAEAMFLLQHLNYYRLSAYWAPFQSGRGSHTFKHGARFEDAIGLYTFDRELRLIVMDAIERAEVSARSQWAFQIAQRHGPHAHLDSSLAVDKAMWSRNIEALVKTVNDSNELFVRHHLRKYKEPLPPIWVTCEVMSLGQLSRWYRLLKPMATRRAIADTYAIDEHILGSWLHHLTYVRNVCAHHHRLWNRDMVIRPALPRTKPLGLPKSFEHGSRRLYNTLVILLYLMDIASPEQGWRMRLRTLLEHHPAHFVAMGFPDDWASRPIWQAAITAR